LAILHSEEYEHRRHDSSNLTATKLSLTLRWLAGGSYIDISIVHRIGVATFFKYVKQIIYVIDSALRIEFQVGNVPYLDEQSRCFTRGNSPLTGCVGALDGLAIRISEPNSCRSFQSVHVFQQKLIFCVVASSDVRFKVSVHVHVRDLSREHTR
jgi:hypothetical protein